MGKNTEFETGSLENVASLSLLIEKKKRENKSSSAKREFFLKHFQSVW